MNILLEFLNNLNKIKKYKYSGDVYFSDNTVYNANIITYGKNKSDAIKNLKRNNPFMEDGKFDKKNLEEY